LLANVSIRARVEEILAAGAERAEITVEQVLRELAVLGFSDIGKVVRWRPELVCEEFEDADNPDQPARASDGLTASEGSGESCPLSSMDIRAGKASDEREKTCH
jgi:hypothetical protein